MPPKRKENRHEPQTAAEADALNQNIENLLRQAFAFAARAFARRLGGIQDIERIRALIAKLEALIKTPNEVTVHLSKECEKQRQSLLRLLLSAENVGLNPNAGNLRSLAAVAAAVRKQEGL